MVGSYYPRFTPQYPEALRTGETESDAEAAPALRGLDPTHSRPGDLRSGGWLAFKQTGCCVAIPDRHHPRSDATVRVLTVLSERSGFVCPRCKFMEFRLATT